MTRFRIAIDGPSGAGKSTVARRVAQRLEYLYIDTGAMYRAVGLKVTREKLPWGQPDAIVEAARRARIELRAGRRGLRVILDGVDVSAAIRTEAVGQAASRVSSIPGVRKILVRAQQDLGRRGGVVMEGRDIGTKVFPEAELKIFLDASENTRARRRFTQNRHKREALNLEGVLEEIRQRDRRDRERADSPLVQARDALYLDTSNQTVDEVVEKILKMVQAMEGNSGSG
ncbi:MAG: (d)CMP kinase [Acidobacteria bacterium]|nr:(d)CMP kinase [Acidobacteriota bacterium]